MADAKISALGSIPRQPTADDLVAVVMDGATYKGKLSEIITAPQPINDPVTLNGSTGSTTAVLAYGLNIVHTSSSSVNSARLPLTPVKGKSVTVINISSFRARIFPSVSGGSINGVVDGYVDIPPDGQPHTFFCWENPLPGSWVISAKKLGLFTVGDMTVPHTNGADSFYVGTGTAIASAQGAGVSGTPYTLDLTPAASYWKSIDSVARALKLRVYTNIVADDAFADSDVGNNGITAYMVQAYQNASNGATYGTRATIEFYKTAAMWNNANMTTAAVNGGALSVPPEIGDYGTFYGEADVVYSGVTNQIGLGGQYSRYYFIFGMQVADNCITKDYKFRFELDYV